MGQIRKKKNQPPTQEGVLMPGEKVRRDQRLHIRPSPSIFWKTDSFHALLNQSQIGLIEYERRRWRELGQSKYFWISNKLHCRFYGRIPWCNSPTTPVLETLLRVGCCFWPTTVSTLYVGTLFRLNQFRNIHFTCSPVFNCKIFSVSMFLILRYGCHCSVFLTWVCNSKKWAAMKISFDTSYH